MHGGTEIAGRPTWSVEDATRFSARERRWGAPLRACLDALYGTVTDVDALYARLVQEAESTARIRRTALRRLDLEREIDPAWFQHPSMIGYVAYADRFAGNLAGVAKRLDYLDELQVRYLHLMKVLRWRSGANDGGYAVVDYGAVDPSLGGRVDLEALADTLHERGVSLCLDVVMNHTAREHAWAVKARNGSSRYRAYYLIYPDRTMPDAYEATLPEVFPEIAPGSFTWDHEAQGWVWTTFNSYQWDLNYANPEVFVEMGKVMLDLANMGVDVLRLDAVAFTWKRLGTTCQNQPEAHLIAQAFRALVSMAAPATLLKAEAIVAPDDLVPYLGAHRLERDECQLAYQNQLMVMLWSGLATGDARLARQALGALPPTPTRTTWVNYVRCHDDIGWAVDDGDAAAAGISGGAHRRYLADFYRGDFPGSDAIGAPFSTNAENGDERTCGTTAALCGLSAARAAGDETAIERAVRRLLLPHAVMSAFGGIPLLYMGDELGLDNDLSYLDDGELADDSRWMHRPWMPWDVAELRHEPTTVEHRIFTAMTALFAARRATPALTAGGETWIHDLADPAVLGWARSHRTHGRFYGLANFSDRVATVPRAALGWAGLVSPRDVLGEVLGDALGEVTVEDDVVRLGPYAVAWFVDDADQPVQPPPITERVPLPPPRSERQQ